MIPGIHKQNLQQIVLRYRSDVYLSPPLGLEGLDSAHDDGRYEGAARVEQEQLHL